MTLSYSITKISTFELVVHVNKKKSFVGPRKLSMLRDCVCYLIPALSKKFKIHSNT